MPRMTRLKAERLKRNWNQTELGAFARMSAPDISKIESGRTIPFPAHALRLGKVLGVEPDALIDEVDVQEDVPKRLEPKSPGMMKKQE